MVRKNSAWLALGVYLLVTFLYFGLRLVLHGGLVEVGTGSDPQIFIWSFAWWPHAILHGENPFVTHAIWAPDGTNLVWATAVPGLALLFAPLTLVAGPLASYDVAAVLMPALAAFTAFVLCRYLTRNFWASLVGGYLFGFSNYVIGATEGHLHLTSVFLLPLIALVLLRYLDGTLGRRGLALLLGVLLAAQLSFSTEIAFTATLALAVALVVAYLLVPARRARLRSAAVPVLGGYGVAAVLTSPLLYFALTDFHSHAINYASPTQFSADLANSIAPSDLIVVGRFMHSLTHSFTGNASEDAAYFGIPVLIVLAWLAVERWRSPGVRFLFATIVLGYFVSFGAWLHIEGRQVVLLPWEHVQPLPFFDNILPVRLFVYVALAAAVAVAIWAAGEAPVWARVALPVVAIAALVPNVRSHAFITAVPEPSFITSGTYARCVHPSDNALFLPFGGKGDSMLWQAETDFHYRMASGRISPTPPDSFRHPPGIAEITYYETAPQTVAPLREYVTLKHVTVVVVDERNPDGWPPLLAKLGAPPPQSIGGVLVYRLDGSPPCTAA